jgi:tetratricopeptide (TPR) repeat protein
MNDVSISVRELLTKGLDAKGRGEFRKARETFKAAIIEARRTNDYLGEANALLELSAIIIEYDKDLVTGRKVLEDCFRLYTNIRFDRGIAYAMSNLGSLSLDEGNLDDALQWFGKALAIFEREEDKYGIAMTLHQMGKADKQKGDFLSAEQRWRRSLILFEALDNGFAMGQVLLSLASINYSYHKDLRQAEILLNRALALFEEQNLPHEAQKARHNLALISKYRKGD